MKIRLGALKRMIAETDDYRLIDSVQGVLEQKIVANARQLAHLMTMGSRRGDVPMAHELLDRLFDEASSEAQDKMMGADSDL